MTKKAFFDKLADAEPDIEHWGLPEHERFPLDTSGHVKTAAMKFPGYDADVDLRVTLARNMVKRAADLGVELDPKIAALANERLNPDFDSHIALRKADSAHMRDPELDYLKKLAHEAKGVEQLMKVAQVLQTFDREHNLEGRITDPAVAVFGNHIDPFMREMPTTEYGSVKLAALAGKVSPETLKHLEEGGSIADLPWTTREVVGSFLRDN